MDYEFKTTFWDDFSIAEVFGARAVEETFDRAFKEWKSNYIYLTELVLVLNWKMWDWHKKNNLGMSYVYHKLWEIANSYGATNLEGEELSYFINTLD
jgi:hypothetical protein